MVLKSQCSYIQGSFMFHGTLLVPVAEQDAYGPVFNVSVKCSSDNVRSNFKTANDSLSLQYWYILCNAVIFMVNNLTNLM